MGHEREAELTASTLAGWVRAGRDALGAARSAIDALNVFPVPDGDTGTNLYLTAEAAAAAVDAAVAGQPALGGDLLALGSVLARGALLGARGNSGIILSELWRGFVAGLADASPPDADGGRALALALRHAAVSARAAVATPVEGTVLSVADAAATAAQDRVDVGSADALEVMAAAAAAARLALAATTGQLPALQRAGVVDAGGQGLVVLYDVLERVLAGDQTLPAPLDRVLPRAEAYSGATETGAYEVMYLLDAPATVDLRSALVAIGDSVVVVGDKTGWNVHVHTDDVGAAIEAGLAAGRPHRVKVTWLGSSSDVVGARGLVVVTHGPGTAALVQEAGAVAVPAAPRQAPSTASLLDGIRMTHGPEVIVLTSDSDTRPAAEAAARLARQDGIRVTVIPSRSIVQSLAAVAVHDGESPFDDDVVAMTRAAHATRYAGVTTAVREAITSAGRCVPGDILGVLDGDIAEIGNDATRVACAVLARMLQGGGELVTVVRGADADVADVDVIARWLRAQHPGVELMQYDGGQPLWPLIVGVE